MSGNSPTVYLAGAITGERYDGATDWRERVATELDYVGITAFSPMRGKEYLDTEKPIAAEYSDRILSNSRAIMTRDFFDVRRADLLLVNLLGTRKASIGTTMEIAWGYQLQKPIVLVMEPENVHNHPMIREAVGYWVESLDDAVYVAKSVLLP